MAVNVDGEWVPLYYRAPNLNENPNNVNIGTPSSTFTLRDHQVDVHIDRDNNIFSMCGPLLHNNNTVQLRWMQTASSLSANQTVPDNWRDLWALDNVTVILHVNETHNVILIEDNFDNQTNLK